MVVMVEVMEMVMVEEVNDGFVGDRGAGDVEVMEVTAR